MPSSAPRLLVVDQSLKNFEGHYFEYDLAVIDAATRLGMQTALAPHQSFAANALGAAPVIGRFSNDWNAAGRSPMRAALRRGLAILPERLRHFLLKAAAPALAQAGPSTVTANRAFAEALLQIIAHATLDTDDHVLIHTLGESELLGLSAVLSERAAPRPRLHLVLRYDGTEAGAKAFSALGNTGARLTFWTDTEQLAMHYRDLGAPRIAVLPIPHCLHDPVARPDRRPGPLTMSYLGGARGDKGFALLPGLADAMAEPLLKTGHARLRIQCNYALSTEEPIMADARRKLARFPNGWVELIDWPLDTTTFQSALLTTDLLLLPYRADIYRRRSSGLLVQAMVAGIPTIVPANTWLATEAPAGAHVTFDEDVPLIDAVQQAVAAQTELSAAAQRAAPEARRKHSAERLVQMLVEPACADLQHS